MYNCFEIKYSLDEESAVEQLSSAKQKEEDSSKSQDSWVIKSNAPSSNLPKKKEDVSGKSSKSCLTMLPLHHIDSERAEPKDLKSSIDLRTDSTVTRKELQDESVSIQTKDPNKQIKKTKVRTKKFKKGHLKVRQSKKSKEKRKNMAVSMDEEDSLHATMDLGGTTIPAEPSKSDISTS